MRFEMFDGKTASPEKLKAYGFEMTCGIFVYRRVIMDGQFELTVRVESDGEVRHTVTDIASGEQYALHMIDRATGAFVGAVRADVQSALDDIADKCFDGGAFKTSVAAEALVYAKQKYGDELEFLWEKFPKDAILRRKDTGKWYALFVEISREKLGLHGKGEADILVMRAKPSDIPAIVDMKRFLPAYHMNKTNWFTALLDGDADVALICKLLDDSYALAKK